MSGPSTAALAPGSKRQSMLVQSTPGSPEVGKGEPTVTADTTTGGAGTITAKNVASPGELCGFVSRGCGEDWRESRGLDRWGRELRIGAPMGRVGGSSESSGAKR